MDSQQSRNELDSNLAVGDTAGVDAAINPLHKEVRKADSPARWSAFSLGHRNLLFTVDFSVAQVMTPFLE